MCTPGRSTSVQADCSRLTGHKFTATVQQRSPTHRALQKPQVSAASCTCLSSALCLSPSLWGRSWFCGLTNEPRALRPIRAHHHNLIFIYTDQSQLLSTNQSSRDTDRCDCTTAKPICVKQTFLGIWVSTCAAEGSLPLVWGREGAFWVPTRGSLRLQTVT